MIGQRLALLQLQPGFSVPTGLLSSAIKAAALLGMRAGLKRLHVTQVCSPLALTQQITCSRCDADK